MGLELKVLVTCSKHNNSVCTNYSQLEAMIVLD